MIDLEMAKEAKALLRELSFREQVEIVLAPYVLIAYYVWRIWPWKTEVIIE